MHSQHRACVTTKFNTSYAHKKASSAFHKLSLVHVLYPPRLYTVATAPYEACNHDRHTIINMKPLQVKTPYGVHELSSSEESTKGIKYKEIGIFNRPLPWMSTLTPMAHQISYTTRQGTELHRLEANFVDDQISSWMLTLIIPSPDRLLCRETNFHNTNMPYNTMATTNLFEQLVRRWQDPQWTYCTAAGSFVTRQLTNNLFAGGRTTNETSCKTFTSQWRH
jgi:hypothetical protein